MSKTGHHELKARQKHLFWHSMWSRIILKKVNFFCTRWTHFGTHLFGIPPTACRSPLGLGMGVAQNTVQRPAVSNQVIIVESFRSRRRESALGECRRHSGCATPVPVSPCNSPSTAINQSPATALVTG